MARRVLVPLDESEEARRALDDAIALFPDATLVLLNVFSRGPADAPTTDGNEELSDLESRRHEMLREAMADRVHDGPVETVVEFGNPAPAIVDYVEENDVDHVVLGSNAGGEVAELFVGSVAEEVVDKSPVSVTLVR